VVVVSRDVTERRETEEALRRSEAEVLSVLESITDGFFSLDRELRFAYVNPQAEALLGRGREDLVGEMLWEDPTFYPHYLKAVAEGETVEFEGYYPPLGAWYGVRAYPSASGLSVYFQDITRRKEAEERLRFQAQLLRAVGEAVIALDGEGKVLYWNRAAEEVYGWSSEEIKGRKLREMVVPEDLQGRAEEIAEQLRVGRSWTGDFEVRRRDGTTFPVEGTDTPVFGEDGVLVGVIGVLKDITERKEAEQEKIKLARRAMLQADISAALVGGGSLRDILQRCAEAMVRHLEAAFARIWTLDEGKDVLKLRASAGMYTHTDGFHSRVPLGSFKIGLIAQAGLPHLTNDVLGDPRVHDKGWGRTGRMVAFAGYPLLVQGKVVGVVASFARHAFSEDTTEVLASVADAIAEGIQRKWTESALQASEERFRLLAENAQDVIYRYRLKPMPGFEYVSPSVNAVVGYTPEEHYADPELHLKIVHPDDRHLMEEVLYNPRSPATIRWHHKDGRVIQTQQLIKLICDEEGELVAVESIAREVTEAKRVEEELRRGEERFRSLVQNASDTITILDADGMVRYVSPAVERMLGYRPEELTGIRMFGLVHPDDVDRALGLFEEVLDKPRGPLASGISGPALRRLLASHGGDAHQPPRREQIPAVTYIKRVTDGPDEPLYTSPPDRAEARLHPRRVDRGQAVAQAPAPRRPR
jgi:PAS domain S-box-containing protein